MAILQSPLTFIASIPPVTRYYTLATVGFSALYGWLEWNGTYSPPYLTLVPGYSLFYPWTFVTSAFVEPTFWELIITLITIPPSLRYLERLWGSIETIKFIVVCIGFSNIIAFGFNWLEFMATSQELFLYGMQYHGQMSLQIGVLVAFTQLIPEHQVQVMGFIKARVKTLPMAYLTLSTVMCIIGLQSPWIIIQFGWFVSWIYLRFYKKNTHDIVGGMDTYGDRSETFSLVSWFPPFIHPVLGPFGNFVYNTANRLHLIPTGGDLENGYTQVPGSARAEAERRRAMALKALDQRLANSSSPAPSQSNNPPKPQALSASPPTASPAPNQTQKSNTENENGESSADNR